MELLEASFLQLSGECSRAPSLMQSEKISVKQLWVVGEHVRPFGVWINGAVTEQETCWLKNCRYQTVLRHILLSRLHLMEGPGLRTALETQA